LKSVGLSVVTRGQVCPADRISQASRYLRRRERSPELLYISSLCCSCCFETRRNPRGSSPISSAAALSSSFPLLHLGSEIMFFYQGVSMGLDRCTFFSRWPSGQIRMLLFAPGAEQKVVGLRTRREYDLELPRRHGRGATSVSTSQGRKVEGPAQALQTPMLAIP